MERTPGSPKITFWRHGLEGPPVLLIMGMGMRGRVWSPQIDLLAADHRLVAFDNRGIGRSGGAAGAWTMQDMADDARRVMDAAGWSSAHVVGVSMGGMIAQELSLASPERVRSLSLVATHAGGPGAFLPPLHGLRAFLEVNLRPPEDRFHALAHLLYPPEFLRVVDRAALRARMADQLGDRARPRSKLKQIYAVMRHDARAGLASLSVPAMVVRAGRDALVRPSRQAALAASIPQARDVLMGEAGHGLIFQCAAALAEELRRFVATHDAARAALLCPDVHA